MKPIEIHDTDGGSGILSPDLTFHAPGKAWQWAKETHVERKSNMQCTEFYWVPTGIVLDDYGFMYCRKAGILQFLN